jgi:hypothetical protein
LLHEDAQAVDEKAGHFTGLGDGEAAHQLLQSLLR